MFTGPAIEQHCEYLGIEYGLWMPGNWEGSVRGVPILFRASVLIEDNV